jgi:hypothetical protein
LVVPGEGNFLFLPAAGIRDETAADVGVVGSPAPDKREMQGWPAVEKTKGGRKGTTDTNGAKLWEQKSRQSVVWPTGVKRPPIRDVWTQVWSQQPP